MPPACPPAALGLCDFYANQPILSQKILKGKGWRCTQRADGSWGGEDPCTWPKRSGIVCDGGQTVTAIKINCEASGGTRPAGAHALQPAGMQEARVRAAAAGAEPAAQLARPTLAAQAWKRTLGGLLSPFLADYKSVTQMQIRGCGLTGSVPLSLYYRREFSSMQTLDLSGNRLTGQLPAVLEWGASSLRVINLSGNLFSGPLPERWALNLVNLEVLDLSNNAFSGGGRSTAAGLVHFTVLCCCAALCCCPRC